MRNVLWVNLKQSPWIVAVLFLLTTGVTTVVGQSAATDLPAIVRLDHDFDYFWEQSKTQPQDVKVLRIAAGISSYASIYERFGAKTSVLAADALQPNGNIARTKKFFADRDLTAEVLAGYQLCCEKIRPATGNQPNYFVAYGPRDGTNAATIGRHASTKRPMVILNLVALARGKHWESAIVHETIHTLQDNIASAKTLLERSMIEGVPTYLSRKLQPELSDYDVLLWSKKEWQAAEKNREKIIRTFAENKDETQRNRVDEFLILGKPLGQVRGAPSRAGYYVGYLAAKAWAEKNPERPLKDMLSVKPEEFWQALQQK